jgi:hypothetical protein
MLTHPAAQQIQQWPIERLVEYGRNPRKNDAALDRMCGSIREFGFKIPVLARSNGEVVDSHLRLKAARKLGITQIPVILCDEWTPAQVKAFRLMVNRSVTWADWDTDLLAQELADLKGLDFDLELTGFDIREIDELLADPELDERANAVPELPKNPVTKLGDVWRCGIHRVLCGDSTATDAVSRACGPIKPFLMVTEHIWCESLPPAPRRRMSQSPRAKPDPAPLSLMNWSKVEPDYTPNNSKSSMRILAMTFNRNLLANQKADKDDNDKPESSSS